MSKTRILAINGVNVPRDNRSQANLRRLGFYWDSDCKRVVKYLRPWQKVDDEIKKAKEWGFHPKEVH